jgi:hypothetical protein
MRQWQPQQHEGVKGVIRHIVMGMFQSAKSVRA